jgi:hypothetical protein
MSNTHSLPASPYARYSCYLKASATAFCTQLEASVPHEVVLWHFKWKASLFHIDVQCWGVLLLPTL